MAKRYVLKSFAPGKRENGRQKSNTLFNLSSYGMTINDNIVKHSLSYGVTETNQLTSNGIGDYYDNDGYVYDKYADYLNGTSQEFIAFFDKSYPQRREYLRNFAKNGIITFVLDTIADEAISLDANNYFAYLNIDKLKANISKDYPKSARLIKTCEDAFDWVYSIFGWNNSNDAWDYFKKFLIDGVIAFEIIYDYDSNYNPTTIIAFKEIDPITLEPAVGKDKNGHPIKIWYQFRGDANREKIILDSNLIYISWSKSNFTDGTQRSYLEGLTRSFNMLQQLENSRVMWSIQNAQKRIKFVLPMGSMSPERAKQRLQQMKARYNEDTLIDDRSGEITVNGIPKFSFTKSYFFPSVGGSTTEISELGVNGYNLDNTEQQKYFFDRFVLDSKIPANRFPRNNQGSTNPLVGDSTITREEYAFSRFIQRLRNIWKEILIKPVWVQISLKMPDIAQSEYFRSFLGIDFYQDNIFAQAKERTNLINAANAIQTLAGLRYEDQSPVFSTRFLVDKLLDLTELDKETNEIYLEADKRKQRNGGQEAAPGMGEAGFGGEPGFGGESGFGGEANFGGEPEFGGELEPTPEPEAVPEPEPAPAE